MTLPYSHLIVPGPRENIEDNLGIAKVFLPILNLFATLAVVTDGVGGEDGGEVASEVATKMILAWITAALSVMCGAFGSTVPAPEAIRAILVEAMMAANAAVLRHASKDSSLENMATTAVCALALGDFLYVAWVGDSRAYVHTHGALRRLTRDHSEAQDLIDAGLPDLVAENPRHRSHVITRFVGQREDFRPDVVVHTLRPGDIVLLATDGLTDVVRDDQIGQTLAQVSCGQSSMDQAARSLVRSALTARTTDNTSVLIFEPIPAAQAFERTKPGAFPAAVAKLLRRIEQGA